MTRETILAAIADGGRASCAPAAAALAEISGPRTAWMRSAGFGGASSPPERRNALARALLMAWRRFGEEPFSASIEGVPVFMEMASAPIPPTSASRRVTEAAAGDEEPERTLGELLDSAGDMILPPSIEPAPGPEPANDLAEALDVQALIGRNVRFSLPAPGGAALSVTLASRIG